MVDYIIHIYIYTYNDYIHTIIYYYIFIHMFMFFSNFREATAAARRALTARLRRQPGPEALKELRELRSGLAGGGPNNIGFKRKSTGKPYISW